MGAIEAIPVGRRLDEVRQLVRPKLEIVDVEDAFRETPEKTRHPAFENLAARTQDASPGPHGPAKRNQVELVAARAMEHQHGRLRAIGWRLVDMNKIEGLVVHYELCAAGIGILS